MRMDFRCMAALVLLTAFGAAAVHAQTTLSASTDANTITANNSIACSSAAGQTDNSYVRVYNTASTFTATAVRVGIEACEVQEQTLTIRFWNYTAGSPAITLGAQIGASTVVTAPADGSWNETVQVLTLDSPVVIPAGNFAVEVQQTANQWFSTARTGPGNFFFGSNQAGESSPTYLLSAACGAANPTEIGTLGAFTVHAILDVVGFTAGAPAQEIDLRFPSGAGFSLASGSGVADVGPFPQSATTNATIEVANQGTGSALNISSATATGATGCTPGTVAFPASVAAGTQGNIQIPVTLGAGVGNWSFTLTVNSNDANEAAYTITVQGTAGMSGTYTVIAAGGGDYTDPGAAFDDLEDFGIAGATIIEIGAGTYTSNASYELGSDVGGGTTDPVRGTSTTNTLTIRNATGATPIISGDAFIDPVAGTETGAMSVNGVSNIIIEGLEFTGGTGFGLFVSFDASNDLTLAGQFANYATDLTVRKCVFHSITNGAGLLITGNSAPYHDILIENCMLYNNGIGNSAYGLNMPGAIGFFWPGENIVIDHCTILNDAGTTAAATGQPAAIGWTGGPEGVRGWPTINNSILVADGTNLPCYAFPNDDPGQGVTGTNEPTAADRNVLFTQNGGIVAMSYFTGTTTQAFTTLNDFQIQFNGLDVNSVDTDPNLTSATDLHILTGSSAIDLAAGSTVADDIDGDTRPNGTNPDSGADEFTGGGGPTTLMITGPASLPNGTQGVAYGPITVTATGGTTPYSWGATGLPAGVTINPTTGVISGTPTATGTFNVTVTVTDSTTPTAQTDTQNYTFDIVGAGTLIITTGQNLAGGTEGTAYSANITAANGTGAHTWSVTAGALPAGVTLGASTTATVAISGTPTANGTFNFTIQVTDSSAPVQTDTQAFTLVIAAGGGGGPGGGVGGGGGGGGGCAADAGNSHWLVLVGLLAMLGVVGTLRTRKQ